MGMATESQFHVLAVDDSIIDRRLIERLLKTSSYQVTTVDSGSKALEFLGLQRNEQTDPNIPSVSPNNHPEVEVNLIITDYCMPGMTGYDLLKKVKESSCFRNIPVVIMSSEHEPSRITRCLEEGAEEFFLKPVSASDVRKLKTHMMKSKLKNQKQESHERLDELLDIKNFALQEQKQTPPRLVLQEKQQELLALQGLHQQQSVLLELQEPQHSMLLESQQQLPTQQQSIIQEQMQSISQPNNNKRKSMDEGLPSDSTRPRYEGITTMV